MSYMYGQFNSLNNPAKFEGNNSCGISVSGNWKVSTLRNDHLHAVVQECGLFQHLLDSPDLVPSDYYLFLKIKKLIAHH